MKKYFITSDIHSYYNEFIEALNRAQFDINNDNHILIICGDLFDRGPGTVKLYNWIKALPKKRRILIRGNHEYLLLDLIKKIIPQPNDYTNGTYDTFCDLNRAGLLYKVNDWINSTEWFDYYELDNYIFVHSFIPTNILIKNESKEYNKNWRINSSRFYWIYATWGCPWKNYKDGLFDEEIKKGKILVCGHWHTSDFYNNLNNAKYPLEKNPIYLSKNLIGLDACTALTHGINILTLENNKLTCYNYIEEKEN